MSGQGDLDLKEEVVLSPAGQTAKPQDRSSMEERRETSDDDDDNDDEEEEELISSAHLEPSTLPWPGDKGKNFLLDQEDEDVSESERIRERQDLLEEHSQTEGDVRSKTKWRESMPEGERWRDDEIQTQRKGTGDGSLADDDEEEKKREWIAEKPSAGFTPNVEIVHPIIKDPPEESRFFREKVLTEDNQAEEFYQEWEKHEELYLSEHSCSEKWRLALALVAAALFFPLLVWGGYALLPFDPPLLQSPPLRVLYTLRCSFFATIPIVLGVLVQGVARLRFSVLKPIYQGQQVNKEVMVHWHYVNESLSLFLFYFLQLAVLATYISQDLIKLVPLLTIVFVFGRLIYWLCLALNSTIRGFGFGLSFFPTLTMLGANLYYVCSSVGQGVIFDVAPPVTAAPPPRMRWWF